jgi:FkbM family methyltransferase
MHPVALSKFPENATRKGTGKEASGFHEFFNWILRLAGTSLRIVRHPTVLGRFVLLRTYLRIALKAKLLFEICGIRPTSERVFGQTIHFFSYEIFAVVFEEVFVTGVYYFPSAGTSPLIVDGGANIGVSLAYFKTIYPECRVLAFEPNAQNFALLEKNASANGWTNISLYPVGLHRTAGELEFFDYNANPGSLSGGFWQLAGTEPVGPPVVVPTVRLSSYLDETVDLLKLDVEGSEMAILEELVEAAKLTLVRRIIGEYHHHVQPGDDGLGRFLTILETSGFSYHLCAPLPLPFPEGEMQNILFSAYHR